jgi:hypothetical protein
MKLEEHMSDEKRRAALSSRAHTAQTLDVSTRTVRRLEDLGKLTRIRLTGETGAVFHPIEEVEALAKAPRSKKGRA